jgi:hypothetical protein
MTDPVPEPVTDAPGFPGGYQGSGPVYAAVPLGGPWYTLAVRGAATYVVEAPVSDPAAPVQGAAFLDRTQAEMVADAIAGGQFTRYEGLTGWNGCTPARRAAEALAAARLEPEAGQ